MAKFVVTSDWHIGARMGSAGRAAARFREVRFETAERILRLAADKGAGALFLLGDTFDGDRVGGGDVDRTLAILKMAPCPVFVLPGNHDWWHRGGVLASFARAAGDVANVTVLTEPEAPLLVDGLPGMTFYPCPLLRHAGVSDPTAWIPARGDTDGRRVGLIHGALDRADWGGTVPERVAEVRDLDLALLGDWHKPVDGPDGRTHYAGSPEAGGFDESHRGQVIVSDAAGVERVDVGRLRWRRVEQEMTAEELGGRGPEALEGVLADLGEGDEDTAVRLHLSGSLSPTELDRLDEVLAAGREAGFAEFDVQGGVSPLGEPDLDSFGDGPLREVARQLWQSDEAPEVRRAALAKLASLSERVR